MFSALRVTTAHSFAARSFSSTSRAGDLSKLTLIGHLVREPEARLTKNDREYISYTVAVRNQPAPPDHTGERPRATATFHRILSFNEGSNKFLRTLRKGTKVYCETIFELKEPVPDADPTTPQGQRQIFLRHETLRILNTPRTEPAQQEEVSSNEETTFN